MSKEIQEFFKENKYVVIRKFLEPNIAGLFNEYCRTQVRAIDFKSTFLPHLHNEAWDGSFGDPQIPGMSFYRYGDPLFDTLMEMSTATLEAYTGLELDANYTYWRFYQKGDILKRHRDRASCEISTTLCIGYDVSDVDQNVYPDYNWPMFVEGKDGSELPVHLNPGDMIIYRGCDVDHWRDKFIGKFHSQVFMHYNDKHGPHNIKYDGRPFIGIPKG